jgi:membrane-associated phospholipid phosphatase
VRRMLSSVLFVVALAGRAAAQTQGGPVPALTPPESAATEPAAPSAGASGTPGPSVGSLFTGFAHDLAHLPTVANAVILTAGGALSQAVHHEDVSLTVRAHAFEPLDEIFDGGAPTGSGWVQVGGALGVYAFGRIANHIRVAEVGADLVRAQLLNTVVTQGIKLAVDRTRPDLGRHSFPSGHTSSAFATATVLQHQLGWKVGIPAYTLATYVGASRMTENKHFASDVIFGAALGIVAGRTVTVGRGEGRFALAPVMLPGGAAVMLSHTQ